MINSSKVGDGQRVRGVGSTLGPRFSQHCCHGCPRRAYKTLRGQRHRH